MEQKQKKRDMWKKIPWKRRAEISEQIENMPEGMRKEVLRLAFIEDYSTTQIAKAAETSDILHSRNHRPISRRRIQQIIAEEIPDYNAYQIRGKVWKRKDHYRFIAERKKERCANCGAENNLEWHHMIPIFLGGKSDAENMVCLCADCHEAISAYHRKQYPEFFTSNAETADQKI